MVICLEQGADLHMAQLMTLPLLCLLTLASVKSRLVLPFWYRLTWVVPEKGPLNGCVCVCTQLSRYQKGKTNLDFSEARDSEWQWHQLGNMQVCTLLQTDNDSSTPPLSFFTGQMPFLPPNQQRQSTEDYSTIDLDSAAHHEFVFLVQTSAPKPQICF